MTDFRNILLCVAGMTPQVVTETLQVLTQVRRERVDEIRVVTTLAGRDRLMTKLLDPETGRFFAFCRDHGINPASIAFDETRVSLLQAPDGRLFDDIRTEFENECAANHICRVVRELTRDPSVRLHASAAGGRKTMGIYLTAALQLFGRAQDRLSHVLVSEEFETHPEFFYIPPTPQTLTVRRPDGETRPISTADAQIHLADIPFIRLRGLVADWIVSPSSEYGDLVRRAQADLNFAETEFDARIDFKKATISVGSRTAKLTVGQLYTYAMFVRYRLLSDGDGFVPLDEITTADLDAVLRWVSREHREIEERLETVRRGVGKFGFLENRAAFIRNKDRIGLREDIEQSISKIKKRFIEAGVPETFWIVSRGKRGNLRYGLDAPKDRLVLNPDNIQ